MGGRGWHRLLSDVVRVETRLYNAVDDRLRHEVNVSLGRYDILVFINSGGHRRVHDIADALALTVGAASKAVDRIVEAGLCVRESNPSDGRSSFVVITPAGRQVLEIATPIVEDEIARRLVPAVTPQEVNTLRSTVAALLGALEQDGTTGGTGRQVR